MKGLFFIFLMLGGFMSPPSESTDLQEEEEKVKVIIQLDNGETLEKTLPVTELRNITNIVDEKEVNKCIVMFPDGTCTSVGDNCDEACAAFTACACATGNHPDLCEPGESPCGN